MNISFEKIKKIAKDTVVAATATLATTGAFGAAEKTEPIPRGNVSLHEFEKSKKDSHEQVIPYTKIEGSHIYKAEITYHVDTIPVENKTVKYPIKYHFTDIDNDHGITYETYDQEIHVVNPVIFRDTVTDSHGNPKPLEPDTLSGTLKTIEADKKPDGMTISFQDKSRAGITLRRTESGYFVDGYDPKKASELIEVMRKRHKEMLEKFLPEINEQ